MSDWLFQIIEGTIILFLIGSDSVMSKRIDATNKRIDVLNERVDILEKSIQVEHNYLVSTSRTLSETLKLVGDLAREMKR